MTKTSVSRDTKELDNLRNDIKETAGLQGKSLSPYDFDMLEQDIREKVAGVVINAKTLKRFFGYDQMDNGSSMRLYTLDVLSQYVGYANWNKYLEHLHLSEGAGSGDFKGKEINAESLQVGDTMQITWLPNRKSTLKYLGNQRFEIIETENSKWQVGDTFICKHFIQGKPLYVNSLTDKDGKLKSVMYMVGEKEGIQILPFHSHSIVAGGLEEIS